MTSARTGAGRTLCATRTLAHRAKPHGRLLGLISSIWPGTFRAHVVHMANGQPDGHCAALLSRVDGDQDVFSELCDIFLDDAPKRLAAIRRALDAGDGPGLRAAAHAFKGAAGVFDATGIVDAARMLEQMGEQARLEGADAVYYQLEIFSRLLLDEIRATREGQIWKS